MPQSISRPSHYFRIVQKEEVKREEQFVLPGAGQIIYAPQALARMANGIALAAATGEVERTLDRSTRLVQHLTALVNASLNILPTLSKLGVPTHTWSWVPPFLSSAATATVVAVSGGIVSSLALALETYGYLRAARLINRIDCLLDENHTPTEQELRRFLEHYIEPSEEQMKALSDEHRKLLKIAKMQDLIDCVGMAGASYLAHSAPDIHELGQEGIEAVLRAVQTEAHKKKLVRIMGMAAAFFLLAACIAAHLMVPVLPIVYLALGIICSLARYTLHKGLFRELGWKTISARSCLYHAFVEPAQHRWTSFRQLFTRAHPESVQKNSGATA